MIEQQGPSRLANTRKRRGAAAVEMAVVCGIFFLMLFGIVEYCRLCFVRQVVINAAREGARYVVVRVPGPGGVVNDTKAYVKTKMVNLDAQTSHYDCGVYMADANGNDIGQAEDAKFGQLIAVEVQYDYTPILPSFLFMSKTLRLSSKCLMISEAN